MVRLIHFININSDFYKCRWEDGTNLTPNLFTLIPLTAHKNTSDICSYKPYTEKEKKTMKKKGKKIEKKSIQKLCDMYIDSESGAKKQQHSNQFFKGKAQLHHLNNHSFNITHLDLATQMK